jgi:GLPGLI family protein
MKLILAFITVFTFQNAIAQLTKGTISYERKMNLHKRLTGDREQMKAFIPEFRTTKHVLLFTDSISVFKAVQEASNQDERRFEGGGDGGGGGERRIMFIGGGPGGGGAFGGGDNSEMFKDFSKGMGYESREIGAKNYIIEDTLKMSGWKISGESKTIQTYTCFKATMKNAQDQNVIAWFAVGITNPSGPETYGGLPGVILEMDINDGESVITTTAISDKVEIKDIKEPKRGKHIARAEYNKMMRQMMENQGGGGRGGGQRFIIRQ